MHVAWRGGGKHLLPALSSTCPAPCPHPFMYVLICMLVPMWFHVPRFSGRVHCKLPGLQLSESESADGGTRTADGGRRNERTVFLGGNPGEYPGENPVAIPVRGNDGTSRPLIRSMEYYQYYHSTTKG